MRNKPFDPSNPAESRSSTGPEIDYSPKTYTLREQFVIGIKLFSAFILFFFLLWLVDRLV